MSKEFSDGDEESNRKILSKAKEDGDGGDDGPEEKEAPPSS